MWLCCVGAPATLTKLVIGPAPDFDVRFRYSLLRCPVRFVLCCVLIASCLFHWQVGGGCDPYFKIQNMEGKPQ